MDLAGRKYCINNGGAKVVMNHVPCVAIVWEKLDRINPQLPYSKIAIAWRSVIIGAMPRKSNNHRHRVDLAVNASWKCSEQIHQLLQRLHHLRNRIHRMNSPEFENEWKVFSKKRMKKALHDTPQSWHGTRCYHTLASRQRAAASTTRDYVIFF
jgi:hypothetical protein